MLTTSKYDFYVPGCCHSPTTAGRAVGFDCTPATPISFEFASSYVSFRVLVSASEYYAVSVYDCPMADGWNLHWHC